MIVEIGPRPYVARAYPAESFFFATDAAHAPAEGVRAIPSLPALWRALERADLVVCHPNFAAPWSARHLGRTLLSRRLIEGRAPIARALGPELLRRRVRARLAVIDHEDLPVINRGNLFLLDRCDLYFKRELPPDRWRVFLKTAHANLPTPRFRLKPRHARWVEKLRPISLGLPADARPGLPPPPEEKRADVFFAGRVEGSSTLRARGLAELRALADRGVAVDIPEAPLPPEAFYRRCAAAWLVWSPEGLGWDCFRHYEAPLCGAAPLINLPTIERHRPLVHGEHALYYDPEPGGLANAVRRALADKPALARMAEAAKAHVLAHHTPESLARYVVEETLGR
ncbi:MAG: glycosyltransferase [Caulobacteraceae bacterium]